MSNSQSGSKTKWYARPAVFLVGLGFLSVGLGHMLRGQATHQSYWSGAAFAPVLIGAMAMYLAVFRQDEPQAKEHSRRGRRH
jgi:phage gp37-like protein